MASFVTLNLTGACLTPTNKLLTEILEPFAPKTMNAKAKTAVNNIY
jgi:hypothetical protein